LSMLELSLYILDIAQNSISAGASIIEISVDEDTGSDLIIINISDNGCGMTEQQASRVDDPFYTTRTTRRVGLGIPLFRLAAEQAGGKLTVKSRPGRGTSVTASFVRSHVNCLPLGDISGTLAALIRLNPNLDFCYRQSLDGNSFSLDTKELRRVLDGVPLDNSEVVSWIAGYVNEQIELLSGEGNAKPGQNDLK
jgi:anti-sigma regulatory factor (Ser/Thr protein kinase)